MIRRARRLSRAALCGEIMQLTQPIDRYWRFSLIVIVILAIVGCSPAVQPTLTPAPTPTITPTPIPEVPTYIIELKKSIINYMANGALGIQLPGTFNLESGTVQLTP